MPVRRYRDVSEMEEALWYTPGDPAIFQAMKELSDLVERVCPQRFPAGVYKHRSIEELYALEEAWEEAHFRAFQEQKARQEAGGR